MQFSLTPQTLSQMDNVPLQYTGRALDSLDRMGEADQLSLADLANLNEHNAAMRPMLQQHQGLQNQSLEALIPGQRAQSNMSVRKDTNENLFNADTIEGLTRKHGIEKMNDYAGQLSGIGSLMLGAAAQVTNAPLGGTMAAKQMFQQAGIGDKWHPEWDNLDPKQLAERLSSIGNEFVTSGSKAQQALQTTQLKNDMALEKERQRGQIAIQVAAMNAASRERISAMMAQLKVAFRKETAEQLQTALQRELMATDPTDVAHTTFLRNKINELQHDIVATRTQPGVTPKVDADGKIIIDNKQQPNPERGASSLPSNVTTSGWNSPPGKN